jgi:two-component system, chemotaxis family, sensor kinase CheA
MDNFRKKFIEEATEHINELEKALLQLEHDPENKELVEKVFRAMHSLKGGGAMFGFDKISEFTHNLENVYDYVRNGEMYVSSDLLNVTLASVDHLSNLLNDDKAVQPDTIAKHKELSNKITDIINIKKSGKGEATIPVIKDVPVNEPSVTTDKLTTYYLHFQPNEGIFDNGTNPLYLLDELNGLGQCIAIPHLNKIPAFEQLAPSKCYTYWEIFLATSQDINSITDVFIFVEDECTIEIHKLSDTNLFTNKLFQEKLEEVKKAGKDIGINDLQHFVSKLTVNNKKEKKTEELPKVSKENTISSIRVSSEKLDNLMNLVSELVTTQARLTLYGEQDGSSELIAIAENVQKLSRQLRDIAFSIVLIPIENLLTRFQRLVRDLSKELKKEATFIAEGTDTELDKTIIENLTDPLLHILRNSLDHGIEDPATRLRLGKPRQGTILLKAFYSGANVHIQISDDGAGIDPEKIRLKAISKGLMSPEVPLSQKELMDLLFLPGFSTAANITDVSGRGVGMDVVRRKIADIRGEVEIESKINQGTTITIKLPLTLSIIDGLLVKVKQTHYVIPLTSVDKIYAADHNKLVNTFNNIIILDGQQIPFFYLREEFDEEENHFDSEQVVVVRYEDIRIGLAVDTVIGEYQAVLKPLGKYYKNQEIISGATILGDGTIALVFDTNKAIKYFASQNVISEDTK